MFHRRVEARRRRDLVHQSPFERPRAPHPFLGGREEVGAVPAHLALVDHAHQASGSRQHPERGHLGQRHRARPVVGEQDPVRGERELVAASRRAPADRAQVALPGVGARVLDRAAGLVGELAEGDLVRVGRRTQHADVRSRAEHPLLRGADDHRRHLGMLEAQALHRIGELDVDSEVVGVELERVARVEAARLVDVEQQGGDAALDAQAPVAVSIGMGANIDHPAGI